MVVAAEATAAAVDYLLLIVQLLIAAVSKSQLPKIVESHINITNLNILVNNLGSEYIQATYKKKILEISYLYLVHTFSLPALSLVLDH